VNNDQTLLLLGAVGRIIEPMLHARQADEVRLQEYSAGSDGPADSLLREVSRTLREGNPTHEHRVSRLRRKATSFAA
jgi:hypothetical protein